ncbi:MAG: phosphate ABC transporter substrate-binding protein PstS [Candidatus Nanopelagicales bacterium]
MSLSRTSGLAAVMIAGALALTACGSDGGSGSTSSSAPAASIDCASGSIKASGSSAQKNAIAEWVNAYIAACPDATIDYQATGSGAGVTDFINKQTAFAGSDSALKEDEQPQADARCASGPAINIPMVGGAINVVYNVEGLDKLVLDAPTLAGIFNNTITKWNDPKIAALNSGATLPDATIAQFHRSDESGTTDNFTKYLIAKKAWDFDGGKAWVAPGGQGAKGSDGVASAVKSTANSIGYVELSFAEDAGLSSAWIDNGNGPIEPTSDNAATTISSATVKGTGNNLPLDIDRAGTKGYPIVLVTYEITCEKGLSGTDLDVTKSFLTYTSSADGQAVLSANGYVPISGDLLTKVQAAVAAIG